MKFKSNNIISIFILLSIMLQSFWVSAKPSFNCDKAQTNVEKLICEDYVTLSGLDNALNIIYKEALQVKEQSKLKKAQQEWLKKRNLLNKPDKEELKGTLIELYDNRIRELLNDQELLKIVAKNQFNSNEPINSYLLSYVTIALLENEMHEKLLDFYNLPDDFEHTKLIKPSINKFIVVLCVSTGAHRKGYRVFEITNANNINIKSIISEEGIVGNIGIDEVKKIISYYDEPNVTNVWEFIKAWQFDEVGFTEITKEQESEILNSSVLEPDFLIGEWYEKNNSKDLDHVNNSIVDLKFFKEGITVLCSGKSFWRGITPGAIHDGQIEGKVIAERKELIVYTDIIGKTDKLYSEFSVQQDDDSPREEYPACKIYIKIIDQNTILVNEADSPRSPCGGVNATFNGTFIRKQPLGFKRITSDPSIINNLPFKSNITDDEYCRHFAKLLPNNTFKQFQRLVKDNKLKLSNIGNLVKTEVPETYLLSIEFPDQMKGFWKITLPRDLNKAPRIEDKKLLFPYIIKEILQSSKSGIWLLVKGSTMQYGIENETYALVSLKNPDKSFEIFYTENVSEELESLTSAQLKEEKGIEKLSKLVEYKFTDNGQISFKVMIRNLKDKKETTVYYIVGENGFMIRRH